MNLGTMGNKTARSYELIKLKIEEREHILQLGILSVSAVGMIILESLMPKETLDSEILMGCKQDILAIFYTIKKRVSNSGWLQS